MRRHILVATDFSTPCKEMVDHLGAFRERGARRVTLVYVRRERYPPEDSAGHEQYYRALLDERADKLRSEGWEVEVRNELGRAGSRIVGVAGEVGAEMILLASRGKSAVEDVLLGNVATDVIERSPVPVFLYSDRAARPSDDGDTELWEGVLHPTDFSGPADRALSWIPDVVAGRDVAVELLHVVDDRYFGPREREEGEDKLEKRRQRLGAGGVSEVETSLVSGRPKKVLVETAADHREALVVMGSHGHGWFEELVFGGVARSVARRGTNHMLFVPRSPA